MAHLQVALQQQHPPTFTACLQSVLMTIPPPWRAVVEAAQQLLPGSRAFQQPAASSFKTPKQDSITRSAHMINCISPMLRLPQLPAMCMSFLGTLLDLGGVQHGNQLSQLLRFTHKGSCGAPTTCQWGCGAGDSSLPTTAFWSLRLLDGCLLELGCHGGLVVM